MLLVSSECEAPRDTLTPRVGREGWLEGAVAAEMMFSQIIQEAPHCNAITASKSRAKNLANRSNSVSICSRSPEMKSDDGSAHPRLSLHCFIVIKGANLALSWYE